MNVAFLHWYHLSKKVMESIGLSLACFVLCTVVRCCLPLLYSHSYVIPSGLPGTDDVDALEPLRQRYNAQHYNLRKFYYECSNLKYLTGLINVPKLGQDPPNLTDSGTAPDLPKRPTTAAPPKTPSPPPTAPTPDAQMVAEQARMLKEYEDQQAALLASQRSEEERRRNAEAAQQAQFEEMQRQQLEAQRLAQEELQRQQMMQMNNMAAGRANEIEMELLAMRGQYERDQMMLEQYDRVSSLK